MEAKDEARINIKIFFVLIQGFEQYREYTHYVPPTFGNFCSNETLIFMNLPLIP